MLEIRSYRRVFDLERRIYRIDRLRLNPGGIPVRGLLYFLGCVAALLVARALPLAGALERSVPWYLADVIAPGALAALMTAVKIEGRPFHLAAVSLVSLWIARLVMSGSTTRPGSRWRPSPVVFLPDGSDACMRSFRYLGPGAVLVRVAHSQAHHDHSRWTLLGRRPHIVLSPLVRTRPPARGVVVELAAKARMRVHMR
jgi:hypothetical protein